MKKYLILLILLLVLANLSAIAQGTIKLTVNDKYNQTIGYSNIIINNCVQVLADKSGEVQIDKDQLHLQDIIVVSYLGFKPCRLVVDKALLAATEKHIVLEEQVYNLDELQVNGKFNPVKFLKKKKKRFLTSDLGRRDVNAKIDVRLYNTQDTTVLHYDMSFKYHGAKSEIIQTKMTDSAMRRNTIEAYLRAVTNMQFFCLGVLRKYFDTKYLGMSEGKYHFSCALLPKNYEKKYFRFEPDDEYKILFDLNKDGYVTHADYHSIEKDGYSYLLCVDYVKSKGAKVVPSHIVVSYFDDAQTIEITPSLLGL